MTVTSPTRAALLVDAATLIEEIGGESAPVFIDVRFTPGGPDLRPEYEAGHIPGARFADLATDFSRPGTGIEGRRPLPDPEALQATLRSWGLDDDSRVVVYDNNHGLTAGRAWWVLTWAGLPGVRLLDGGYAAWLAAGGAISTTEPAAVRSGTVTVRAGGLRTLTIDEAEAQPEHGVLLDARGGDAYRGHPVADGEAPEGHIPGALDAASRLSLDADGLVLDDQALRARFAGLGVIGDESVGAYCGGGVAGAHQVFTLKLLGIDAALFVGSWSAWQADPDRPVAIGPEPGRPHHANNSERTSDR